MTTTTKTKNTVEQDQVSATAESLSEARDALRLAQEQRDETQVRLDTFREMVRSGGSLPKGKTVSGVEDELSLSALRIEGLAADVTKAEDEHAYAVAVEVATQVREDVLPLGTGDRVEEATAQITAILVALADEQTKANSVVRLSHRRLKALSEDRYGKGRRVPNAGVGIDPNGWTEIRIDGYSYGATDPKAQAEAVLAEVEQRLARHLYDD